MTKFSERLEQAALLARTGHREMARELFLQLVEEAPGNLQIWLWLSELADNLEEQTEMLEKAMKYAPEGTDGYTDLQALLVDLRGAVPLPEPEANAAKTPGKDSRQKIENEEIFRKAERLSIVGRQPEALSLLHGLAEAQSEDERVWQLLYELEPDLTQKVWALENVVDINPANHEAAGHLAALRPLLRNPLQAGTYLEEKGEFEQAAALYRDIASHSHFQIDQVEANRRIARIEKRQQKGSSWIIPPITTLIREFAGQVRLLF